MIKFFGRQKERHFKHVADIAFHCLGPQKMFIEPEDFHIADLSGKINGKALGYVFGFLDALLQTRNLDIRDAEGYAAMISILGRLFPNEVGLVSTYVNYLRKNMEHDAEKIGRAHV